MWSDAALGHTQGNAHVGISFHQGRYPVSFEVCLEDKKNCLGKKSFSVRKYTYGYSGIVEIVLRKKKPA